MAVVRVLPHIVADMIAAGEVVDRPASVVKELVENAIDAGASAIAVKIEGAGREAVVVEDDGVGMEAEDALLSFRRHATSKITSEEDLSRILTLGFRGEALASIASVSKMALVTRQAGADGATRIESVGGQLTGPVPSGGAPGTYVEVRDLFFNTPARRKFLKSDATEVKNIVDTLTRLALVHPAVGFTLESGGRRVLSFAPDQSLEERAAQAVGSDRLSWCREGEEGARLVFAFSPPHEGRGRRDGLKLFVNRRSVNDRILFAAVMEGYRGRIADGRYPTALLWLELDPAAVDVNVHPAKREVRFADERGIFALVSSLVSRALSGAGREEAAPLPDPWGGSLVETPEVGRVAEALSSYGRSVAGRTEPFPSGRGYSPRQGRPYPFSGYGGERPGEEGIRFNPPAGERVGFFASLSYLGAFDATYLIFEDRATRELVLVDQHAAHERILYESLREGAALPGASQQLLVPVVVECDAAAMEVLEERAADLALIGIRAEQFGGRAVSVAAAPAGLDAGAITAIVLDFLAGQIPEEADLSRTLADRAAARAACAGAVKARRELHPSEVEELMARLGRLENPTHCPHGRPLLVRLGREKVAALFLRR